MNKVPLETNFGPIGGYLIENIRMGGGGRLQYSIAYRAVGFPYWVELSFIFTLNNIDKYICHTYVEYFFLIDRRFESLTILGKDF